MANIRATTSSDGSVYHTLNVEGNTMVLGKVSGKLNRGDTYSPNRSNMIK